MSTDCLFREDSYLKDCSATVVALTETGGVVLDRTIFYAASGGQPGDTGTLRSANGDAIRISSAAYVDREKAEIAHSSAVATGVDLKIGESVHVAIDWDLRYARMRMHTSLHLLSAVLPYPVTGGAVGDREGREVPGAVSVQEGGHLCGRGVHRGGEGPEAQHGTGRQGNHGEECHHEPHQPSSPADPPAWLVAVHQDRPKGTA